MSCGSGGCSSGCGNASGNVCSTGACGQMSVHDWLVDMAYPLGFDAVEVKFKGGRKAFYRNSNNFYLATGDPVAVEASPGYHIGYVSAQGELVRLQMKKYKVEYNDDLPVIYRQANEKDLEKFGRTRHRELPSLFRTREIVQELKLGMKLSDVEYQADNTKATFYYSADDRVDFRELIKLLASEFKIRVEMRQISLRQEAGRLGGIGSCGRELCCSTWLSDFKSVSTSAARYQNLSLNPSKLSGQCGRLKCCLNYELETYQEALQDIPEVKSLQTEQGNALLQKTDIFKRVMWFGFNNENTWHKVPVDRVKAILALNKKDKKPFSLELDENVEIPTSSLNSDLFDLDSKFKGKNKKQGNNKRNKNKRKKPLAARAKQKNNNAQPQAKKQTNKPNAKRAQKK